MTHLPRLAPLPRCTLSRRHLVKGAFTAVVAGTVAGCGMFGSKEEKPAAPPPSPAVAPPPEGATLRLTVIASPLINPDLNQRPSPVLVRVYQLSNPDSFEASDFASLFEKDEATLGPAMLAKRELIIAPGGIQVVNADLKPDALFVGAVVGYRNFEKATWKNLFPLAGKKANPVRVNVGALAVELLPN
ncbi:MAG: type VI secretion system lipoprotein TssJ [Alphaproteobacteria bacterium]|nr:type VI secretion system lipoprotein TssJ [Alphaproteobacteria bacterium]